MGPVAGPMILHPSAGGCGGLSCPARDGQSCDRPSRLFCQRKLSMREQDPLRFQLTRRSHPTTIYLFLSFRRRRRRLPPFTFLGRPLSDFQLVRCSLVRLREENRRRTDSFSSCEFRHRRCILGASRSRRRRRPPRSSPPMDPCPFVRVLVGNLALQAPAASRPASGAGIHPSAYPCFATIRLDKHPSRHTAPVPLLPADHDPDAPPPLTAASLAAGFNLSKADVDRLGGRSCFSPAASRASRAGVTKLKIAIYSGRWGTTCGVRAGRLLGRVSLPLDLRAVAEGKAAVFHNGWIGLGKGATAAAKAQLYLTVKAEADPRFVFEFDAESERSPQVFQVQGSRRQPVYTCRFSCRHHSGDWNWRSRSMQPEASSSRKWSPSFGSDRERSGKERKGWSVTVHDLSGSPVALASMVTPFVASPGTDRVSRSNPGAWLIFRPGDATWQPWGRLEAWRERGGPSGDGLGYRFELLPDAAAGPGVSLAESTISASKGGKFGIDLTGAAGGNPLARTLSSSSPRRSGELQRGAKPAAGGYRGFVMSSTVSREGRTRGLPTVEVGVGHVGCAEDAAAFVALAAAVDLSMDACRLFSSKLGRGLLRRTSSA